MLDPYSFTILPSSLCSQLLWNIVFSYLSTSTLPFLRSSYTCHSLVPSTGRLRFQKCLASKYFLIVFFRSQSPLTISQNNILWRGSKCCPLLPLSFLLECWFNSMSGLITSWVYPADFAVKTECPKNALNWQPWVVGMVFLLVPCLTARL